MEKRLVGPLKALKGQLKLWFGKNIRVHLAEKRPFKAEDMRDVGEQGVVLFCRSQVV